MKTKHIVALVGILALLAIATAAAAATATLTVKVVDANGIPMSGASVTIQQGTNAATKKVCAGTSAGLCTFTGVTTGVKWNIVAADKRQPPHTAVKKDFLFTAATTVTLKIL